MSDPDRGDGRDTLGRFGPGNTANENGQNGARTQFKPGNQAHLKFSAELAEQIITAVQAGAYMETAAAYAGVTAKAMYDWMKKGRAGVEPYVEFVALMERALATSEMSDLAFIARARDENWQAAAWRLERRYPDKYGRKTRVESNVTVSAKPFLDFSKLDPAELDTLVALMEKARPDPDDPALGVEGRAAADLVAQVAEADVEDAEWEEAPPPQIEP